MGSDLLSGAKLGATTLANGVVMAPMTRQRADAQTGVPTAIMAEYYAQRASAGLIVTECANVSALGAAYVGGPAIMTDAQVAGWRTVVDAVHAKGGKIYLQLWHGGRVSHSSVLGGAQPVAPSAIKGPGQTRTAAGRVDLETPRALELAEIKQIVDDFNAGAKKALAAGFDGVEIHAAFGYLLDQFLQDSANQRGDIYGGSVANRTRFPLEVVDAVVAVWGAARVGVKIGPSTRIYGMHDSQPLETFGLFVDELSRRDIGYVHIMEPNETDIATGTVTIKSPSKQFRPKVKNALIANGGFTLASGNAAIAEGWADLVSFGKPYVANPDLVERFKGNHPLTAVDFATLFSPGTKGYTDYPRFAG